MFVYLGYANALEEVESGAEPVVDAADEQSRTPVDYAAEFGTGDAGLAEEEGKYRDDVGDPGSDDFRAHAADAAELGTGEAHGGDEIDGGFDVGERGGDDGRVDGDDREKV